MCACMRMRACVYALRIVSRDKNSRFVNPASTMQGSGDAVNKVNQAAQPALARAAQGRRWSPFFF